MTDRRFQTSMKMLFCRFAYGSAPACGNMELDFLPKPTQPLSLSACWAPRERSWATVMTRLPALDSGRGYCFVARGLLFRERHGGTETGVRVFTA